MIYPKRKKIHLERELYQGPITAMATVYFFEKLNVIDANLGKNVVYVFNDHCKLFNVRPLVFCLMPDHIHLILEIDDISLNFLDFISSFKRKVSIKLKGLHFKKQLWQDRFIDRIIRDEKELIKLTRYILDNPVRKGLVDDFRKWPYSGGYYFNLWK